PLLVTVVLLRGAKSRSICFDYFGCPAADAIGCVLLTILLQFNDFQRTAIGHSARKQAGLSDAQLCGSGAASRRRRHRRQRSLPSARKSLGRGSSLGSF